MHMLEKRGHASAGDEKGAGTDADVKIRMMGTKQPACSLEHSLGGAKSNFERASVDTFVVESDDLGQLTAIELSHNNIGRSPGWLCEQVIVVELDTPHRYTFHVGAWLDEGHGCSKVVKCRTKLDDRCSYTVRVKVLICFWI
jgi:lipoxygenase homology domain-containing protein 1